MMMSEAIKGLKKRAEDFRKGHIAVASRHVQKMHDTSVKMGAKCEKSIPNKGGVMETAAVLNRMLTSAIAKLMPGLSWEKDALAKAVNDALAEVKPDDLAKGDTSLAAENVELRKTVTGLQETNKAIEERLVKLEQQPAPARIVIRAIDKEADGGGSAPLGAAMRKAAEIAAQIEPIKKSDGTIDEVATAVRITRAMGGHNVSGGVKPAQ